MNLLLSELPCQLQRVAYQPGQGSLSGQRLYKGPCDRLLHEGLKVLVTAFARRPVTLSRFPDGVLGKAFYEKDAPDYLPTWAHTTNVPRLKGGEPIRYICIDDVATMVWCANVASLELHPFLHHAEDLDCPTSVVFDLDPGEGVDLVDCAKVALLLQALLERNGLECLPKVSGSKGLQVYVPLNTRVTYGETPHDTMNVEEPSMVFSIHLRAVMRQVQPIR